MNLIKLGIFTFLLLCVTVVQAKLKVVALKGPHGGGFIGLKAKKPKLLGLGGGGGAFGAGGFHKHGYEHHEYHTSYHGGGGAGAFGGKFGFLGK